ncbi:WAT1-related protein At4g28040, partial [Linum perenne]
IRNLYIILSYDKPNLSTFKDTFSDSLLETHFLCQSKRISIQSAAYLKLYTLKSRKNTQIDKKPESSMGSSYKPGMIMVALEFSYAALALFTKAAFTGGLSPRIFVVYRQAIATLIMSSLAFVSNRMCLLKENRNNPTGVSLTLESFSWIFAASLFGVTGNQNAYFEGINLASSTAATAIINLIPAVTFVIAAIFGMEKIKIRSVRSGAKIAGTVICVLGAIAVAFLKGPKLLNYHFLGSEQDDKNWLIGCLLLFASSFFWSLWIILQVPIAATCPDLIYSSAWLCFLATTQSIAVALFMEKDFSAWKLNSIFEMGCCLYGGAALAVSFLGQAWCVAQRGPVFPAIFNPLCSVITAIFAAIFLKEQTYMGGLIGAVAVIIGLYMVLWGKAKDLEEAKMGKEKEGSAADLEEPFLTDKPTQV